MFNLKILFMKKLYFIIIQLFVSVNLFAQIKSINTEKSKIKWIGREITTKIHYGSLKFLDGNVSITENEVKGKVIVNMESLNVEDLSGGSKQRLEGHLKSDDFFSVDKHKTAKLEIVSSEKQGDIFMVNGMLTIKNISHPIKFNLDVQSNNATTKLAFDRSKYDVKFRSGNFFENLGDKLILDDIDLEVELYF
tara:strand:+ start:373 stop:951 length:579 start_codon:yes stop_codon:yes gene_type:complete